MVDCIKDAFLLVGVAASALSGVCKGGEIEFRALARYIWPCSRSVFVKASKKCLHRMVSFVAISSA